MINFSLINSIFIFLINVIGLWLSVWVFISGTKKKIGKLFFLFIMFAILNVDFGYISNLDYLFNYSLYFKRLRFGAVSLFFIFGYFLFMNFPKMSKKNRILDICHTNIWLVMFYLSVFSNKIISGVKLEKWGSEAIFGNFILFFYLFTTYSVFLFLYILFKKYLIIHKSDKLKVQYFLIGIIIYAIFNIFFNIIFPILNGNMQYYELGDYSVIILFILTAYAIAKNNLMGIKTLLSQVLIIIISIILLVDITALTTFGFMRMLKIAVLVAFLYFGKGLIESVKKEKKVADKLEKANGRIKHYVNELEDTNKNLEEGNEDLKALINASDAVVENMDVKKIAQGIVDIIPKSLGHLGNKGGIFISYDRKQKMIQAYAITESSLAKKTKKILGKSLEKHKDLLSDVDNLVAKTIKMKKVFVGSRLEDFITPTVSVSICKMIQKVSRAKSFVSVPLYSRGNVNGVLLFVGTKNVKNITQRDKNILYMFSSHIGSAVENARLYEQTVVQIEEMERLNRDLGNANVKLKELLEVKNEFLHITSHQLRTPLTAIRGMISMWYDGDFDDLPEKEKRRMVKRILISTERLNNITNDMLDALELEGGFLKFQFKPSSVGSIVKETIDTLKPNFDKKNIYVKMKMQSGIPDVEVEPNYIRQVFMNVIDNACKYTKKGGVDINIKKSNNKYVEVKIKDSGVGVDNANMKKVFEKFARAKNAIEENASGSGLGMFIAKKIVNAHGGEINFSSKGIGKGSTVKILLKISHN